MTNINNDIEFKSYIESLPWERQRLLAIKFVEHAIDLVTDQRVMDTLETAKNTDLSEEVLSDAFHGIRRLVFATYTQCGHEIDMLNVAEHYVALAAAICIQPQDLFIKGENPACKAALHCRQARSFQFLSQGKDQASNKESHAQYKIAEDFGK
ncbi:MAG: hypothetical protein HQL69_21345 [Magnetococcales bacterium]|nr:hypothetical protein [Magnetococcales bacterium]